MGSDQSETPADAEAEAVILHAWAASGGTGQPPRIVVPQHMFDHLTKAGVNPDRFTVSRELPLK